MKHIVWQFIMCVFNTRASVVMEVSGLLILGSRPWTTFIWCCPDITCCFHNSCSSHLGNICICQQHSLKPFLSVLNEFGKFVVSCFVSARCCQTFRLVVMDLTLKASTFAKTKHCMCVRSKSLFCQLVCSYVYLWRLV